MGESVNVKDILYYARIIPTVGIYDVCQLTIRTVKDNTLLDVTNLINMLTYSTIQIWAKQYSTKEKTHWIWFLLQKVITKRK